MRIALVSVGTRGDVQPYVAVGKALTARGHQPVLVTHEEYEPLAREHGLDFRAVRGGFRELMKTDLGRNWLSSADSPLKYAKYAQELFVPLQKHWLREIHAGTAGCDAVVFYAMAMHAIDAAELRRLPTVCLSPWPVATTARVPPPVASWLWGLPGFLVRRAWDPLLRLALGGLNPEFQAYRAEIGLPPHPDPSPIHRIGSRRIPVVHLFSEHVLPRPDDWESHVAIAGFSFMPHSEYAPDAALARFLEGEPPIYMGFGSMTGHSPEELAQITRAAARRAGVRAVFVSGWGDTPLESDDTFHVAADVPHDWLFPRVRAVVHHGGVGTFAEGLRAGRPTVITAFFGDQPFWGRVNERLGTGPKTLKRRGLTADALATAIRSALDDARYRTNAAAVGARIAREDGAARAAELVERFLVAR
jgi:sterol 3beta-glucosyltransferase